MIQESMVSLGQGRFMALRRVRPGLFSEPSLLRYQRPWPPVLILTTVGCWGPAWVRQHVRCAKCHGDVEPISHYDQVPFVYCSFCKSQYPVRGAAKELELDQERPGR